MAVDPAASTLGRRLQELEELYEALGALTSTLDLPELLRTALDRIRRLTASEALSLLLYDPERNELVFAASETLSEDTLIGRAPLAPRAEGLTPATLTVPLRAGDRLVGSIELRGRLGGGTFDEADHTRLAELAAVLVAQIDIATLPHDERALHAIFHRIAGAVPSHVTVLALHDAQGRELTFTSSLVLQPGAVDGVRLRLDQGIAGWVARERTAVCLDDASRDPRHDPALALRTGLVPHTMLCVPLLYRDRLLGVVQVINKFDGRSFTADELRLVQALAHHAAIAIANAQLYRQAEKASLTDDLTGLSNTRHFNAVLPAALARGGAVSLLMLDLDALKAVVDRHGHLVGSRTIATVGRIVAEHLRPGDLGARFGGDEFVVLLPSTPPAEARDLAEAIRRAIDDCGAPDGMTIDISHVTASVGVATFPAHAADAEGLFRAADTAMYRVKNGGKNGVGVAGQER
jgi:diguanylate cyclase (GGDEF)-like protein